MSDMQTEAEYSRNLNTKFRLLVDAPQPIDLTLVEVTPRKVDSTEEQGMERFSAVFMGPREIPMPSNTVRSTRTG